MNRKELEIWTTKEGKEIHVDEMSDSHVRNAFKMLLRKINYHKEKLEITRKSNRTFEVNGELAAEDAFNYEIYQETGFLPEELDPNFPL